MIAPVADGTVAGFGGLGYELAVEAAARLAFVGLGAVGPGRLAFRPCQRPANRRLSPAWTSPAGCRGSPGVSPSSAAMRLLVSKQTNIRYLTGFTGSAGMLLVLSDDALLVTDGRYRDQAADQVEASGAAVRIEIGRPAAQLAAVKRLADGVRPPRARGRGRHLGRAAALRGRPYLRARSWSLSRTRSRRSAPSRTMVSSPGSNGLPTSPMLPSRRSRSSCARARPSRNSRQRSTSRCAGEERSASRSRPSSPAGRTRALPHARPTGRRVEPGELVVIDFGATVDGYRSDMTRTVSVGAPASGELAGAARSGARPRSEPACGRSGPA